MGNRAFYYDLNWMNEKPLNWAIDECWWLEWIGNGFEVERMFKDRSHLVN